jgi:methylmalonyl-CoA mutase
MSDSENLFGQFSAVSTEEWINKIKSDLRGEDFNRKLVWKTNEGFDVMPFYRREDILGLPYIDSLPGDEPFLRGYSSTGNNWLIRQDIEVSDYPAASRKALDILMKGVDSLGFILKDPETINKANISRLLKDIDFESIEINFCTEGKALELLEITEGIILKSGCDRGKVKCTIEADPLSRLMVNGALCVPVDVGFEYLAGLMKRSGKFPLMRTVQVHASNFANAGADAVKELAFAISMAAEYMTVLTGKGISPDMAASGIKFRFATGSNYFMEIAKLRAARILWSVITRKFNTKNSSSARMEIHSVTTDWNKTLFDQHVNLLRSQTEIMAAALGGANSITADPFDKVTGNTTDFSERIARNQQLLLKEEAYFDKVADPGGGSYYIEMLTSMIAGNAWKLFLEAEETGGFLEALKKGIIQKSLRESAGKRLKDISGRKEILLGTNHFPDASQTLPDVKLKPVKSPLKEKKGDIIVEPLRFVRGGEELEKLRLAVDSSSGKPKVFLLTIGNQAMRRARSQFSASFFACGGYKVIDNPGFKTVEEGVKSALDASAEIIVICSSDEEYAEYAPMVAELVKGRAIVVVAGNPACMDDLKAKGISHFISIRSDMVETLAVFHKLTGVI